MVKIQGQLVSFPDPQYGRTEGLRTRLKDSQPSPVELWYFSEQIKFHTKQTSKLFSSKLAV